MIFDVNFSIISVPKYYVMETQQQRVDYDNSINVGRLNISLIRIEFILAESIIKTFIYSLMQNQIEKLYSQCSNFIFMDIGFLDVIVIDPLRCSESGLQFV